MDTVTSCPKLHGKLVVEWLLDHEAVQAQVQKLPLGHWTDLLASAHTCICPLLQVLHPGYLWLMVTADAHVLSGLRPQEAPMS